jgi:hypothetical protein
MNKFFRTLLAFVAILSFASAAFSPKAIFAESSGLESAKSAVGSASEAVTSPKTSTDLLTNPQTDVVGETTIFPKVYYVSSTHGGRFNWDVLKTGPVGPVMLELGQSMVLNYSVVVSAFAGTHTADVSGRLEMLNNGTAQRRI